MTREVLANNRSAKLTANNGGFEYTREDGASARGGYSIEPAAPGTHSVLIDGRVYRVTRGPRNEVTVNGRRLTVECFDPRDRAVRPASARDHGVQHIAASMPGRVVRVLVAKGESVEEGQGLVVVEAMKMQNEMKSPKAGRVAEVRAVPEATVAAGQVLIVVE